MQIITGKYRARKLVGYEIESTRPTLARVKESVFNMLQSKVAGSVVLDLFAGSGAFGVECISRGSRKVFFVDSEKLAIDAVKKNTHGMSEDFEIINSNYEDALKLFRARGIKFDLVYLDPPYNSDFASNSMKLLSDYGLLVENSLIVVEHRFKNDLQNIQDCYIMKKSKKYGIALVDIFEYKN